MTQPAGLTAEVAVVIPTRNRIALVRRAVRIALAQQHLAVAVIVVDDGSDDGTAEQLHAEFAGCVQVIHHVRPRGVSAARNAGMRAARCAWIAFLDDDDVWAPDKLWRQLRAAREADAAWAYAGMVTLDMGLRILHGVRPDPSEVLARELPLRNRVPSGPSNFLIRADALAATTGFDEALSYDADWDLWLRILQQAGPPAMVGAPLVGHVEHGGNMPVETHLAEVAIIERRYAHLRGGRPLDWAHIWRWIASAHLDRGRPAAAAAAYSRALLHDPSGSGRRMLQAVQSARESRAASYRPSSDGAWIAQAEQWLSALRPPQPALAPRKATVPHAP